MWPIEDAKVTGGRYARGVVRAQSRPTTKPAPLIIRGPGKGSDRFHAELNAQAREIFNQYRNGPYHAAKRAERHGLGTLSCRKSGSALWQGAAWDPETNML